MTATLIASADKRIARPAYEVVHQNPHKGSQSLEYTEVRRYGREHLVRAVVIRDTYDKQSSAAVSVWNGTTGWNTYATISFVNTPAFAAHSYGDFAKHGHLLVETAQELFLMWEKAFIHLGRR